MGAGRRMKFLENVWCGDVRLRDAYPSILGFIERYKMENWRSCWNSWETMCDEGSGERG